MQKQQCNGKICNNKQELIKNKYWINIILCIKENQPNGTAKAEKESKKAKMDAV